MVIAVSECSRTDAMTTVDSLSRVIGKIEGILKECVPIFSRKGCMTINNNFICVCFNLYK